MQKSEFELELEILGLTSFVTSGKGMNDYYGDEENYVNDSNDQNYVIIVPKILFMMFMEKLCLWCKLC